MRILMLSWEYPPHIIGGLGRHVTDLTDALAQIGVEVHILTPHLKESSRYECVLRRAFISIVSPSRQSPIVCFFRSPRN
jgi:glycogen synthase